MKSTYLQELNPSQLAAVEYCDGPSLIVAGAGSGKTRVLTYKIAYLLSELGYQPWNILALTFTNKAAREMKTRIIRQVGEAGSRVWMGTFHSIFARILRQESQHIGFTSHFTIYDASDSKNLIKTILKEQGLDEKVYKPGVVQDRISRAKNHLLTPDQYEHSAELRQYDNDSRIPLVSDIYHHYWNRCRQSDAMDFDDLLLHIYLLFEAHPDVLARYQEQFRYLLVDEYQDTNYAQHSIVLQLTRTHRHVCVVGDDAQSIYSFRGADIDNILFFQQTYPDTRLFKLEQNYRSTQTIVDAANSLIAHNQHRIQKSVYSRNAVGDPIRLFEAYSDVEEVEKVSSTLQTLHRQSACPYADFAILYRTNAQSRLFEEALRKRGIPYRIYGGLSFYQRKEVKDVISYFRLVANPHDEEAFRRVINYPTRGIGETTQRKLSQAANDAGVSLWTVLDEPLSFGVSLNKSTHAKLQAFRTLIDGFRAQADTLSAFELGTHIIRQTGIMTDLMADVSPEGMSRKQNIDELANGLHEFCDARQEEGNAHVSLTDYLSEVSLLTDQDTTGRADADDNVTLMTIHSAKGLEFRYVFIVGLEEDLFPSAMSNDSQRALEEERRLFYVALTRAEEQCFLSYARSRFRYGKMEFGNPSRFLRDIDPAFLQSVGGGSAALSRSPRRSAIEGTPFNARTYGASYPQETLFCDSPAQSAGPRHLGGRPATPARPQHTLPATPAATDGPRRLRPLGSTHNTPLGSPAYGTKPDARYDLRVGQHVVHERFGRGEVILIEGSGENTKAHIRFDNLGEKQLLLRFARFKAVD